MMHAGMDYETGRSKGFAHVQFEEVAGAAAAIAKSGFEMEGRELFIDSAKERPASGNTPNSNRGATLLVDQCLLSFLGCTGFTVVMIFPVFPC